MRIKDFLDLQGHQPIINIDEVIDFDDLYQVDVVKIDPLFVALFFVLGIGSNGDLRAELETDLLIETMELEKRRDEKEGREGKGRGTKEHTSESPDFIRPVRISGPLVSRAMARGSMGFLASVLRAASTTFWCH